METTPCQVYTVSWRDAEQSQRWNEKGNGFCLVVAVVGIYTCSDIPPETTGGHQWRHFRAANFVSTCDQRRKMFPKF